MNERRNNDRYSAIFASCLEHDSRPPRNMQKIGVTKDISLRGARLLARSHFSPGSLLDLKIMVTTDESMTHQARVARVSPINKRSIWRYELGVVFDSPLSQDIVDNLVEMSYSIS